MKLLLTSAGITTKEIANALSGLVGKALSDVKVGFVPTAANVEVGNKDWFLAQLTNLQRYGVQWIDVIDPTATGVDWQSRLAVVDVIFISGGNYIPFT